MDILKYFIPLDVRSYSSEHIFSNTNYSRSSLSEINQISMKMTSKSSTNTSAMDSRKELSELIKRKAEISVKYCLFTFFQKIFDIFLAFSIAFKLLFIIYRLISKVWKGKYSLSKGPIWRIPSFMVTSFEAGIVI